MAAFSDLETQLKLRAVLLTVSGLPPSQHRVWDNSYVVPSGGVQPAPYKPTAGVPYMTEKFSSGPSFAIALGTNEYRGIYYVTIFGVPGLDITPIRTVTDAIRAAFPMKNGAWALPSGNIVRVRRDVGPTATEITPLESGHSYSQVAIPWLVWAS